jgi:hypothetical protein
MSSTVYSLVVLSTDAIVDPGTMVVKLGHADVAKGTMLGPHRLPHEARRAEPLGIEARSLGQFNDRLLQVQRGRKMYFNTLSM